MSRYIYGFSDTSDNKYVVRGGLVYYHIENKDNWKDVLKNGLPLIQSVVLTQNVSKCLDNKMKNKKDTGDKSKYFEPNFNFEDCETNLRNKKRKDKKHYFKNKKKKTNFFSKDECISYSNEKYIISDEYEDIYYTVEDSDYEETYNYADYKDSGIESDYDLDFERFHYRNGSTWSQ
jgi:hypothetical protein